MNTPASTASAITDEQIRRLFVKHGHLYPLWLELGRDIFALAAPTTQPTGQAEGETPSMVVAMDEGAKEPRIVSWNALHVGTHWLYARRDAVFWKGPIDANALEAMAKERPDEMFLKGSGVLKLIGGIRTLERELREARAERAAVEPSQPAPDPYNACESFEMYGLVCRQNASLLKQIEKLEDELASRTPAPAAPSQHVASAIGGIAQVLAGLLDEDEWAEMERKIAIVCTALQMPAAIASSTKASGGTT